MKLFPQKSSPHTQENLLVVLWVEKEKGGRPYSCKVRKKMHNIEADKAEKIGEKNGKKLERYREDWYGPSP